MKRSTTAIWGRGMAFLERFRNREAAIVHDLLMIPVTWFAALWLRFNLDVIPEPYLVRASIMLPVVVLAHGSAFAYFGLYRGVWRFASLPDLLRISKAVAVGAIASGVGIFLLTRMQDIPRSIFPLSAVLLIFCLGGSRFLYRWFKDHRRYDVLGQKALIVGAGRTGELLVRDLLRNPRGQYQPVAFVDDNRARQGKEIQGIRVFNGTDRIPVLVVELEIDVILIAVSTATSAQMRRIVEACESCRVPFRILPAITDLVSGRVGLKELRDVNIEDLLGREPVSLDWDSIRSGLAGKTILVTGAGGYVGAELCRQLVCAKPAKLVMFERGEFDLYTIDKELMNLAPEMDRVAVLGDVCDETAVQMALRTYQPDVVFHVAAYKHVPMLENHVRAAAWNNVIGTWTVASAVGRYGCSTFVLVSTDKAVNPVSVMGYSKHAAEVCCQRLAAQTAKTRYLVVRFGNVLGSRGSAIPLFQEQIARGGPVTLTDQEVTRYFMTVSEATQLILQASVMGQGGEIFVLDMGEPVKVDYVARQLIILSGKTPDEEIKIVHTGLRPGEKVHEALFHRDEVRVDTSHPKILLAHGSHMDTQLVEPLIAELREAVYDGTENRIRFILENFIAENVEVAHRIEAV
jgi:FlaA1/EpsC-like NDP-sugar epimerase